MKKSELKLKDVVDVKRGKKIGYIDDVEIDLNEGRIKAIIVPTHKSKLMSFFTKGQDTTIDWSNIEKIGEDVILVNI